MSSQIAFPDEFSNLYQWIEDNGFYADTPDGRRFGYLFSTEEIRAKSTDDERPGGTWVDFTAEGSEDLHYWFGGDHQDIRERLCVFGHTGGDGSMAAFWIDDDRHQKIVHLGSGSGSILVCTLADNPIDYFRLIAIGYDELCQDEQFNFPPNSPELDDDIVIQPNIPFREWLQAHYDVTIPERASELIKHPATMDSETSEDPFWNWCQKYNR